MITVQWANINKTLLKWTFGHQWSRNDFMTACSQSSEMISQQPHKVHVVIDLSVSSISPKRVISLALTGMRMKQENTGTVVVISSNSLWLNLYQYMSRAYSGSVIPVQFVNAHHDAMKLLNMPFFEGSWEDSKKKLPAYAGQAVSPFYIF